MQASELERCRALPLFSTMREEAFRTLFADVRTARIPAGDVFLSEEGSSDVLHVLLGGQIELHTAWNGQETVLAVLQPVSTFVLAAVVLDAGALLSARALGPCDILMVPGDVTRRAMLEDAPFAVAASRDLAQGFRSMAHALKTQKLRSGVQRLANHLVLARASQVDAGDHVILHYEKRVLASLLGMTPEHLSRAFATLRGHGVSVSGAMVHIGDLAALKALAKPDSFPESQ